MKFKKNFILFLFILFILVTLFFSLFFIKRNPSLNSDSIFPTPSPVEINNDFKGFPTIAPSRQPVAQTPFIQTNEIINSIKMLDSQQDPVITQNNNFTILYLPKWNKFSISITTSPFDEGRREAEENFLTQLHLNQKQACQLDVTLGTPYSVNPDYSGNIYHLSFCQ